MPVNAESAPLRRGGLRPRWFFYAAAVILVVLAVVLSKSTHVTGYNTIPVVHHAGRDEIIPCPGRTSVTVPPRCAAIAPYTSGGQTYPIYGTYYRLPWILTGLASALVLAGIGLAVDRR